MNSINKSSLLKFWIWVGLLAIPMSLFADKKEEARIKLEIQRLSREVIVALRSGKPDVAGKYLIELDKISEDSDESLYAKGAFAYYDKNYAKSLELLKKAVQKNPNHEPSHYLLGMIYSAIEDWNEAVRAFLSAINDSAFNPFYHHNLGIAYFILNEWEKSERALKKAIELKANFKEAKILLVSVLLKREKSGEAFQYSSKLYQESPNDSEIRSQYSKLVYDKKEYDEVIQILGKSNRLTRTEKRILADSLNKRNDNKRAEGVYKDLVRDSLATEEDRLSFLKFYIQMDRDGEADRLLTSFGKEFPERREVYQNFVETETFKRDTKKKLYRYFPGK